MKILPTCDVRFLMRCRTLAWTIISVATQPLSMWATWGLKECKVDLRSRVARFENPIVAVKHVVSTTPREKDYTIVHVSFQSTGSTNIQCVNVLREVTHFVRRRGRGRGDNKRVWDENE